MNLSRYTAKLKNTPQQNTQELVCTLLIPPVEAEAEWSRGLHQPWLCSKMS